MKRSILRRSVFRRLLSQALALLMLVATTGIPVHSVYCACLGERVVGLITEVHTSCSDKEASKACLADGPSCCQPVESCCNTDDSCMHREVSLSRLNTDLIAAQSVYSESSPDAGGVLHPVIFFVLKHAFRSAPLLACYPHGPPGPIRPWEGLDAHVAFGQFRC